MNRHPYGFFQSNAQWTTQSNYISSIYGLNLRPYLYNVPNENFAKNS